MGNTTLHCDELGIPKHLHRDGRPINARFQKKEWLYRRMLPGEFLSNDQISAASIKISEMSVNRDKYTKFPQKDVLYNVNSTDHFFSWGIVKIRVDFLEGLKFRHPTLEKTFTFKVMHDPGKCMYPHSILLTLVNNESVQSDLPKTLRATFREEFRTNCAIVKNPD